MTIFAKIDYFNKVRKHKTKKSLQHGSKNISSADDTDNADFNLMQ